MRAEYRGRECEVLEKEDTHRIWKARGHYDKSSDKYRDWIYMGTLGLILGCGMILLAELICGVFFNGFKRALLEVCEIFPVLVCVSVVILAVIQYVYTPIVDRVGLFAPTRLRRVVFSTVLLVWVSLLGFKFWYNTQTEEAQFLNAQLDKIKTTQFMEDMTEDIPLVSGRVATEYFKSCSLNSKMGVLDMFVSRVHMFSVLATEEVDKYEADRSIKLDNYTGQNEWLRGRMETQARLYDIQQLMAGTITLMQRVNDGDITEEEARVEVENLQTEMLEINQGLWTVEDLVSPPWYRVLNLVQEVAGLGVLCLFLSFLLYKKNLNVLRKLKYI